MGESQAMVAEGYNASAATVESNVDSSQSVANVSLVNRTGPEGSLTAPAENGTATDNVPVTAPGAGHVDNAGNSFFYSIDTSLRIEFFMLTSMIQLFTYSISVVKGSALSPEEERLWSIVRANSSEFNAWTALIEETERISQVSVDSHN